MLRATAVIVVLAATPVARAGPSVAVRAGIGVGLLEEITWEVPEVDVAGTFDVGARGLATIALGYTSVDNHTYLADGRAMRLAVAGGAHVTPRTTVAATLALELFLFHADPDVVADHPGVDIIASRHGLVPTTGVEGRYAITPATAAGVFARVGLRELELFDTPTGDRGSARMVLAGAFIELRVR